eukprot:154090_1
MTSCQRCFVLTLMIGLTLSDWVTKTGLPHTTAYMAVGSYNDAIFILGGYGASIGKQVVEYSVTDQGFTDHGDEMQYNAYGGGDFYTQIGNTIYMLSGSGSNLNTFDMTNRAYTPSWKSVSTPVSHTGCLASSSIANIDYIYVVGGYDSSNVLNKVQVLNTNTMQWLSNIPSMKTQRNRLSCIVDPSTLQLYAIAGKNNGGATDPASFLKTIEKIDVNNMGGNQWGIISSTLTFPAIGTRSIIYQERILVIGGRYADNGYKYLKTIHVIDPQTDEVTLPYTSLPRGVAEAAAVIMNGNLYVFGGSICSGTTDCNTAWISYMILQLPTPSPTSDPTNKPSPQPTVSPTFNPTIDPTVTPTSDPTTIPSIHPSVNPTISPTVDTGNPTKRPTIVADNGRTSRPTHDSSGRVDENGDDDDNTDEFGNGEPEKEQSGGSQRPDEYYIVVIVVLLVGVCCVSVIYVYYKRKRRPVRTGEDDVLELAECHAITTTAPGDAKGEAMHEDTLDVTVKPGENGMGEDDIMVEDDSDTSNDDMYKTSDKDTVRETPRVVPDSDEDDENHGLYSKRKQPKTAGVRAEDSTDEDTDGDELLYNKPNKSKTEK